MVSVNAPPALDCQSLQFRQLCKLKSISDSSKETYKKSTHLLATCHLYGLIFVGEKSGIKVIPSGKVYEEINQYNPKNVVSSYIHRNVPLPSPPIHVDVNADQKLLSVVFAVNNILILRIYYVESIFFPNLTVVNEIRLSSVPGTCLSDLLWNPVNPNMLACCISDGTFTVLTINSSSFSINNLLRESGSTCACWSPKGKQLVVGDSNGQLTQYLPDLKEIKKIPPPNEVFNKPCFLMNVKWLSTFQFIGAYREQQSENGVEDLRVCIIVINTPKQSPVSFVNYEDVCYSNGISRAFQYYFFHLMQWNLLFIASSRAVEIGILSLSPNNNTWYQWNLDESHRVVLPMNKGEETYPIGISIDLTSQIQTSVGETMAPMPIFTILTDEGLLCLYSVNNLQPGSPCICIKANPIPSLQYFSATEVIQESPQPIIENVTPEQSPVKTEAPSFTTLNTTIPQQLNRQPITSINTAATGSLFGFPSATKPISSFNLPQTKIPEIVPVSIPQQPQPVQSFIQTPTSVSVIPEKPKPVPVIPTAVKPVTSTTVEDSTRKALNVLIMREEAIKKLKKRATTFESEIQAFKILTSKIKVDNSIRSNDKILTEFSNKCTNLNKLNDVLRNEIDNLKTSIIEVNASVQDIKSKQFLLTNPGYQSLSNSQTFDAALGASLKKIEKNIYFVQSQIELADKQLDEIWFKFCENSPELTTKVPKLENIYRTIVIQRKIVNVKKVEVQELEKKMKEIKYRMSLVQSPSNFDDSYASPKWYSSSSAKVDSALTELTKKLLTLEDHTQNQLDPNNLSERCHKELAKRFTLSNSKQIKLQELLSAHTINYVRSAKLQRLKKKSLIILSKSKIEEPVPLIEEIEPPREIPTQQFISPVSSEDEATESIEKNVSAMNEKVVSSTPVKNVTRFNIESFVEEPSVIFTLPQITKTTETPKVISSLPSITTAFKVSPKIAEADKTISVEKGKVEKPVAISSTPSSSFNKLFLTSTATTTTQNLFFGSKLNAAPVNTVANSGTLFSGLKLSSTPVNPVSTPVGSSFFGQSITSSLPSNTGVMKDISSSLNLAPKAEPKPTTIAEATAPSLFSNILTSSSEMATTTVAEQKEPQVLFKPFTVSTLPCASAITQATTAISTSITFPKTAVSSATNINVSTPIFGNALIFGKPQSSAETINFGSFMSPSNSVFGSKPIILTSSTQSKSEAFGSFSFATKTTSGVTISEISSETGNESESIATEPVKNMNSFSLATTESSSATIPTKTETFNIAPSLTVTPPSSPLYATSITITKLENTPATTSVTSTTSVAAITTSSFPDNAGSFFGGLSITAIATTASSIFGKPAVPAFSGNLFSQNTTVTSSSGDLFGQKPSVTTAPNLFAQNTSVTSSTSFFSSNVNTTTSSNLFSQNTQTTSTASNLFASKPATSTGDSKPIFGTGVTTATGTNQSLFGQATNQENKSVFGQPQNSFQTGGTSIFGGSSLFGSGNSFSATPSTTPSNTFGSGGSIFGSANTFGNNNANTSFQGSTGGFGSASSFSSPTQTAQNSGGFGSPPAFSSVFKSNNQFSAFGGAPSFGGTPAYSSPTKLFGQSTNINTFGAGNQQPTAFENIANENTMSFGNLAQQQQPQPGGFGSPPSFGATPSAPSFGSPGFGGQSFSSWR